MLQFLPLPQLGEYALIGDSDKSNIYNIMQLPEDAQTLWSNLGDALRTLATPGDWATYQERTMQLTANPLVYNQAITDMRSELLRRKGKAKDEVKLKLAQLEAAYQQVQNVRIAELKSDWYSQWKRIQDMIRDLSTAYWQLHQSQ
ncbi:MAG: hypothetical protein NVSMB27_43550 [Ktedonobacteraceae bacterium]